MRALFAGLAIALFATATAHADDAAMAKAANDFYTVALPDVSGLPDAKALAKLRPTITPGLATLLEKASASEAGFMKANKDSPPVVEGDLYSSLFEGPTSFAIGTCAGDAKTGHCAVNLTYNDKVAKEPVHWSDTLYLANTAEGWKVDDIGYGGTWDFGNKGRLSETLQQVVKLVSE